MVMMDLPHFSGEYGWYGIRAEPFSMLPPKAVAVHHALRSGWLHH